MTRKQFIPLLGASILCAVFLAGCSIHTSSSGDKKNNNVDIRSPFGSISVHEGNVDAKDIGLPVYPGAKPKQGHDDEDSDNANVNISTPFAGVKVLVQKFETDDSPDKVLDFYQKPMGKYGKVLQCSGGYHGGHFHHHEDNAPVSCDNIGSSSERELKVGTENDQHVVAVKPQGNGTEFTLVYVRAKTSNDKDTI
jgi:hypothetical protein